MKPSFTKKSALLLLALPFTLQAAPITLTSQDQTDLAVTLYSNNLGLIQDTRTLPSLSPDQTVIIRDVSKQMQTETLQINGAGKVKEQTLNSSILSYQSLLEHHIGKPVTLVKTLQDGEEVRKVVTLLSFQGGRALVQSGQKIESIPFNDRWRFVFNNRPDNLLLAPSLTFKTTGTADNSTAKLSYLTQGLSWKMNYVMTLNPSATEASLDSLASLSNSTGTVLNNARVKLIAGEVNRVRNQNHYNARALSMSKEMSVSDSAAPESLSEYKLYTLPNPVTLQNQQQTQVPLIHADAVKVASLQRFQFHVTPYIDAYEHKVKADNFVRFTNNKQQGLGQSLPAGAVRFFAPDKAGELQYIGGSHIRQTALNEKVELATGKSTDVTIVKKQLDFQEAFDGNVIEYGIRISNASAQDKNIEISSFFSVPWELISSSYKPSETNAGSAKWQLSLQGKSDTLLTLRVRLKTKKSKRLQSNKQSQLKN